MTNYIDKGLETDDPVVAAMFLGETVDVLFFDFLTKNRKAWKRVHLMCEHLSRAIRIPWPTVLSMILPVEGEVCFCYYKKIPAHREDVFPSQERYEKELIDIYGPTGFVYLLANALTTGKTVGELRELNNRCRKKVKEC